MNITAGATLDRFAIVVPVIVPGILRGEPATYILMFTLPPIFFQSNVIFSPNLLSYKPLRTSVAGLLAKARSTVIRVTAAVKFAFVFDANPTTTISSKFLLISKREILIICWQAIFISFVSKL